jgi:hypothetical protein
LSFLFNSERHQLVQQVHMIGGGAHGPQAAQAIRHAAAQNGVWSLGNFGGVPPKSAMLYPSASDATALSSGSSVTDILQQSVSIEDYRFIFNSAGVGMVRRRLQRFLLHNASGQKLMDHSWLYLGCLFHGRLVDRLQRAL